MVSSIESKLGFRVQKIDHVGSTAIPGIAAKPVIDIDLTVADPTDEENYLALEKLGFQLKQPIQKVTLAEWCNAKYEPQRELPG